MKELRIIKRYQNRKLYDTCQSSYVTLEEISHIIRDGSDIKVLDNKTKEDITFITQIQILFDQERKSNESKQLDLLKRVVRSSTGTFTGHIKNIEISKGLTTESDYYAAPEESLAETFTTESEVNIVAGQLNSDTITSSLSF